MLQVYQQIHTAPLKRLKEHNDVADRVGDGLHDRVKYPVICHVRHVLVDLIDLAVVDPGQMHHVRVKRPLHILQPPIMHDENDQIVEVKYNHEWKQHVKKLQDSVRDDTISFESAQIVETC